MRRVTLLALLLVLIGAAAAGGARAQAIRDSDGAMLSCPDPSVLDARVGGYRYYLVCTSDYAPDAFPIRGSDDLVHWHPLGYVFPAGKQPWWALPSPIGRYWSPALYRLDGRWVVYFAAQYNAAKVTIHVPNEEPDTFVLGVATASSLNGPWHSSLLHYRGQFNGISRESESYGGVIDPSLVRDTATGQNYLFWAEQTTALWASKLSANGLHLDPQIHRVFVATPGWEGRTPRHRSVVEGPSELYRDGWFYLFYSGASTWTGTYAIGAAVSRDPLKSRFLDISDEPVLQSGHGWIGPGGQSAPVTGPDGQTYLFYHVETHPNAGHVSADRYLMMSRLTWTGVGGFYPSIDGGLAG